MFNKSIAYRLSIFISLAVISVFLIFIIASFFFNKQILREYIETRAIGLSSKINMQINRNISVTREVTDNVSAQIIYYAQNDDAEKLLFMVMEKYPFLNNIHINIDSAISMPNHHFLLRRDDDQLVFEKNNRGISYCDTHQEISDSLRDASQAGWTEPYRCMEKGKVFVTYYCPVRVSSENENKHSVGIVNIQLSLTELNETINRMEIGERGYAFLVNKKGEYITHPDQDRILEQTLFKLPGRVLNRKEIDVETILKENKTGSAIIYPPILDYEKSWVYYTPISEMKWFLLFIMPYNELFRELYILTMQMFFFAVLGIIIIYFIITYISNRLIEPLSAVTTQLNNLSRPGGKEFAKTLDEVKQVSDSLNYLESWFEKYQTTQNQEQVKSHRWKQDLQQASEIQRSLIKTSFPAFPDREDIDLYAIYKPAAVVSGDLFDYFFVDEDNLVFTIGDVSGKGIPAAIFMSIAQTIIKNNALFKKAKNIVNKANNDLFTSNQHQFFLTLFLGILNIKSGELNYCNAAHTISYILKADGNITELKQSHGLPLGLYSEKKYNDSRIKLEKGDKIVLYTDGVTEQQDSNKIRFGVKRFKEILSKLSKRSPAGIATQIENSLTIYRGKEAQNDDVCVFVIEYKL